MKIKKSKKTEPTSFINVDLEIFSDSPIDELVEFLSRNLFFLHKGLFNNLHHSTFEVRPKHLNDDPNDLIKAFYKVISSLPSNHRKTWDNVKRSILDFGFQASWKPSMFSVSLSPETIKLISELKTIVVVTIYGASSAQKLLVNKKEEK